MGTRAIWQSTEQTSGHGAIGSGTGTRRRVREFRIGSDVFATLRRGEAVIYTTLGPDPQRASILPARLPANTPQRIRHGDRHPAEIPVHPEETLPTALHHNQPPSIGEIDIDANDIYPRSAPDRQDTPKGRGSTGPSTVPEHEAPTSGRRAPRPLPPRRARQERHGGIGSGKTSPPPEIAPTGGRRRRRGVGDARA
jgi:hypothetical protein